MSEKEFNEIFSRRLRFYLSQNNMSQIELAKILGVSASSVSDWVNGRKSPRMNKVDTMCELFNCRRSDFLEDTPTSPYLVALSPEDHEFLQAYHSVSPELRTAARAVLGLPKEVAESSGSEKADA